MPRQPRTTEDFARTFLIRDGVFSIFLLVLGRVQVEEEAMEWHHWVGVGCCSFDWGEMAVFVFQVQVLGLREFCVGLIHVVVHGDRGRVMWCWG